MVILVVGGGSVLGGWRLESRSYLSSLLLELGTTAMLVLPLLWVERHFERRVEASEAETRQQVSGVVENLSGVAQRLQETRQSLSDLQAQMSARLQAAADADSEFIERAREDVSFKTVEPLLRRAGELSAIHHRGLRVGVPGQWERVRFRYMARDGMRIAVEDAAGRDLRVRTLWRSGQTAVEGLVALAEVWKRSGSYPGDHAMDAGWIFERLLLSLDIAVEGRRTRGDRQLHPLFEMVSSTWAMTDYGLEHVPHGYVIPREELATEEGLQQWRQQMRDKIWVVEENAAAGSSGEPDFWMVTEVAHMFFAAREPEKSV